MEQTLLKLSTKYFGEVEYEPEEVLSFPAGLFGFEDEHSFLLLPFEGGNGRMLSLQSTRTPSLAFVALDPFSLDPAYAPVLQEAELRQFGVADSGELAYYVLCAVKSPVSASTVNLRCPIVVHPDTREARQVILETDGYEMRHPLSQFGRSEEAPTC